MTSSKNTKLRVAVLYGGRSGEHEVSLQSAASVIRNLDRARFEVIPVAIDKHGKWRVGDLAAIEKAQAKSLSVFESSPQVVIPPNPSEHAGQIVQLGTSQSLQFDVVFPVMHGPLCEDGTMQGLFELADVAYVGCGVLASSVGMDKDFSKRVIHGAGLPTAPYISLKNEVYKRDQKAALAPFYASRMEFPVFVKPANMGSSVGVHKVKEASLLHAAIVDAFQYDTKILIEAGVDAREIEVSVLENIEAGLPPLVSVPGEIIPSHEFYSYEAKYIDENGAALKIPAALTPEQTREAQRIAREAFTALECEGMSRVDLFLDRKSGQFYFNEVNTIPGFTSISMYPKMWEASGLKYADLLSKLVDLAVARHERKRALKRDFHR